MRLRQFHICLNSFTKNFKTKHMKSTWQSSIMDIKFAVRINNTLRIHIIEKLVRYKGGYLSWQ